MYILPLFFLRVNKIEIEKQEELIVRSKIQYSTQVFHNGSHMFLMGEEA